MYRLTWYDEPGVERREMNCARCPESGKCTHAIDCKNAAVNRLAVIEDILGEEYDLDQLRGLLVRAEEE